MANLREKIQQAIKNNAGDTGRAAIAVCLLLEEEIGLAGNGWFDDDAVMSKELESL